MSDLSAQSIVTEASNFIESFFGNNPWNSIIDESTILLIHPRKIQVKQSSIWIILKNQLILTYDELPQRELLLEHGSSVIKHDTNLYTLNLFNYERLKLYLRLSNKTSSELAWSINNSRIIHDKQSLQAQLLNEAMAINPNQYNSFLKNYFLSSYELLLNLTKISNSNKYILEELLINYMRLANLIQWNHFPPILWLKDEFLLTDLGSKYNQYFDNIALANQDNLNVSQDSIDILFRFIQDASDIYVKKIGDKPNWLMNNDNLIYTLPKI
ncbi:MAG: hypothetical protein P8J51_00025 [Dehalococcoidia bacterium]|nr:hypothetical protein [Dehalococcoidia bacterium]